MKAKKLLSALLSTTMVFGLIPFGSLAASIPNENSAEDYIVVAKNDNSFKVIEREYGAFFEQSFSSVQNNTVKMSLTKEQAEMIDMYNGTKYIEKDIIFKADSNGDTNDLAGDMLGGSAESDEEAYTDNIKMVKGDNVAASGDVKIAVLDSGIAQHDELVVEERVNFIPGLEVDNTLIAYDESGHGTSVAGVIAAKENGKGIKGIAKNAKLYSLQVLNSYGEAPLSRIVEGIDWAIDNDIDILNMSFGSDINSTILHEAIARAYNAGITMVAAAGNTSGAVQYPARYSEVISVGSVDGEGNISDFSANGNDVDIYAPGEGIISTGIFNGYIGTDGTSVAAPHVTAAAAIIKMSDANKTNAQIKALLKATANTASGNKVLDIACANDNISTFVDEEPINNDELLTFDSDGIAVGCWARGKHSELASNSSSNSGINANNVKLMARAALMADTLYGTHSNIGGKDVVMPKFFPLHAYGYTSSASSNNRVSYNSNFLADTKYLYRLARHYFDSSSISAAENQTNIDKVKKAGANYSILQKIVFGGTIYTSSSITYPDKRGEVKNVDVKGIVHMNIYDGISEDTIQERAYKILGLAIHLAGDTYAHRVRVPVSSTESGGYFNTMPTNPREGFSSSHSGTYNATTMNNFLKERSATPACKCFACFKKAVAAAHVEFRDMKEFTKGTKDSGYKAYDDNVNFYAKRFSIATKHATDTLISQFKNKKDFTLFVFLPSDTSYVLKLNYLRGYIDDTGMNWDGLQQSTRDRVLKLSTGSLI